MGMRASLGRAWPAFWILRRQRSEPAWARLAIANVLVFGLSLALVLVVAVLRVPRFELERWLSVAVPVVIIALAIGNTLLGVFRVLELASEQATLERLQADAGWRAGLALNALAAAGIVLGSAIGAGLAGLFDNAVTWDRLSQPRWQVHFALVIVVLIGANALAWSSRRRQLAKRRLATEAQLHLLQAQIEPQFLFNTLAEVQGLLDQDPERARQMLEEFTDYLRASLGQLRRVDSSLAAELDMAQCYLQLLRLRMGERLRFSIEASVQARAAVVPPMLLQPLVENALKHGLEPRDDGGSVHIVAAVRLGRLEISVLDDGVGLPPNQQPAGHALNNIRARLQARYGSNAVLTLSAIAPGTRAMLDLPFVGAAVESSQTV